MILNVEEPEVLRRALLELEAKSILVVAPISTIQTLDTEDPIVMEVSASKLNEVINAVNSISAILNSTRRDQF